MDKFFVLKVAHEEVSKYMTNLLEKFCVQAHKTTTFV